MKHSVVLTKTERKGSMNDAEFLNYCNDVKIAFSKFKDAAIMMKKLGLLSPYRQYELELFIQRNEHYLKDHEKTRQIIEAKQFKEMNP